MIYFTVGPDWKWGNQDGGDGTIGSVYRVKDDIIACVRTDKSSNLTNQHVI